jgi:hypothetical protein
LNHPEAAIKNAIEEPGYQNENHVFLQKKQGEKNKLTQKGKSDQIVQRGAFGNSVP